MALLHVQAVDDNAIADSNCNNYLSPFQDRSFNSSDNDFGYNLCPPWYYVREDRCTRGNTIHGVVKFEDKTGQTWLQQYYCMTTEMDGINRSDVVGGCFLSLFHRSFPTNDYPLPCNISKLNKFMCLDLNRDGQFCGKCAQGFAPPMLSYSFICTNCTHYHHNWLKYIAGAFGPLTVFCLFICAFINSLGPELFLIPQSA